MTVLLQKRYVKRSKKGWGTVIPTDVSSDLGTDWITVLCFVEGQKDCL